MSFHDLGLNKALLRTLEEIGHTEPTPIQSKSIPLILEGRDVVGLAQTGTGKTAAFLLPLLQRLNNPEHKGKYRPIRTLVLTPTRELAAQIFEKARQYGKSLNMRSQCTVGGIPITRQQKTLQRGTDVLIATPGRLLDLAKRGAVKFDHVEALVLDEADHMLAIGFLPDVKRIIAQLPDRRQTLLFSATMPKQIQDLASEYLNNPTDVSVARTSSFADRIDQSVIHVPVRQKHNELVTLIEANRGQRVVVFARTKHGSDKIVTRLRAADIEAAAIHGNKSQGQRERALKAFANGKCLVLIATDIAARGIDIKDVGLVVNYDLPNVPEVYVHRIGRTARAGTAGTAVSLCSGDEVKHLRGIEKLIKLDIPAIGEPEADNEAGSKPVAKRRRPRKRNGNTAKKGNIGTKSVVTDEKPIKKRDTGPQKRKTEPTRPNRRKRKRGQTGQKRAAA